MRARNVNKTTGTKLGRYANQFKFKILEGMKLAKFTQITPKHVLTKIYFIFRKIDITSEIIEEIFLFIYHASQLNTYHSK